MKSYTYLQPFRPLNGDPACITISGLEPPACFGDGFYLRPDLH